MKHETSEDAGPSVEEARRRFMREVWGDEWRDHPERFAETVKHLYMFEAAVKRDIIASGREGALLAAATKFMEQGDIGHGNRCAIWVDGSPHAQNDCSCGFADLRAALCPLPPQPEEAHGA